MHSLAVTGLGIGFIIMGAGLFVLTLRKAKPTPVNPTKTQLRDEAALVQETKKMRLAAGITAGFGAVLLILGVI